jgi:hypothetical protein
MNGGWGWGKALDTGVCEELRPESSLPGRQGGKGNNKESRSGRGQTRGKLGGQNDWKANPDSFPSFLFLFSLFTALDQQQLIYLTRHRREREKTVSEQPCTGVCEREEACLDGRGEVESKPSCDREKGGGKRNGVSRYRRRRKGKKKKSQAPYIYNEND